MPRPKRLHVLPVRLDDATHEELGEAADEEHRSMSQLAYLIIREWLDDWKQRQARSDGK